MSKTPIYWSKAVKFLSKDKIMKKLISKYKDKTLTTRKDIFLSLCKSIIGQQISVAAANSVFLKFKKECKGKINPKVVWLPGDTPYVTIDTFLDIMVKRNFHG